MGRGICFHGRSNKCSERLRLLSYQDGLPEELGGAPQHSDGRLRLGVLFVLLKDATGYIQIRYHRFVEVLQVCLGE
jgi:hypothetical protein